ncbi:MAG TPA: extensin family protein [Devosia sp.]|nr:extensin family protein [Devosia sp.]
MQFRALALVFIAAALPVFAFAANDVPLPRDRPEPAAASAEASSSSSVPVPRERPSEMAADEAASSSAPPSSSSSASAETSSSAAASAEPSSSSAEPPPPAPPAPPRDYQVACPALMNGQVTGRVLPPIHDGQCGIQTPLELTAVSANGRSIPLNEKIITDCGMATAFPAWVADVDSYVKAHDKTAIEKINLSTSYQCRNVDNGKTGNLSFHAFADGLDVMGLALEDGRSIAIAPGFNGTPEQGRDILHFARDAACTHFMTVLSPDADSFHQDNLHLDLGCHGKLCTARLCQ